MASSRPLAAASRLFSMSLLRLQRHHHRLSPAAQSFSTGHFSKSYTQNPFGVAEEENGQRRTPTMPRIVKESMIVARFDVPGLNPEDLMVWVNEDKTVVFEGKCKSHPKYEYEGNYYSATFPWSQRLFDKAKLKYELIHGVLWITMTFKEEAKRNIDFKNIPFWNHP